LRAAIPAEGAVNFTLRDYQQRTVDEVLAAWETHRRILLALPTGGGKTEVAIALAAAEIQTKRRVLVVVERKVLTVQWHERFIRHGFHHIGILQGENTIATWAPILVATAQTLRARGIPEDVGLVVLDESHIWHQTHDKVLDECADAKVLGLSATPLREGLGKRFDKLIVGATIRELTAAGYLVPARVFAPSRDQIVAALESINVRAGDYVSDQLSALMREKAIIGDAVTNWRTKGESRSTIAFCVDKAHARDLADAFVLEGVNAAVVIDETPDEERVEIFARFNAGDVKVLTSVGVLGVGFDSPIASCAILARPTLSTMLHVQQSGRVIRPYEGKANAIVIDAAANTLRHGLPIDFVPPSDLSEIEAGADKKRRDTVVSELVTCKNCEAIYPRSEDACPECGTPRTRYTRAVLLDGKLTEVSWCSGETEPDGPTPDAVRTFYCEVLGHCQQKGWKPGAAWFMTAERFDLDAAFGNSVMIELLPRIWRQSCLSRPPSPETARWLDNRRKRHYLRNRYAEAQANA
jgi:superfamily II DNA or RNA helicase